MQRDDYFRISKMPLLIGGATTCACTRPSRSRRTTKARWSMCPMPRARFAWRRACCPRRRGELLDDLKPDYDRIRTQHANKKALPMVPREARANKTPDRLGRLRAEDADVHRPAHVQELRSHGTCQLHRLGPLLPDLGSGRALPAILNDEIVGESGRRVFADGQPML